MKNKNFSSVLASIIVFVLAILFLFPFYWMLTTSFKSQTVAVKIPPEWIPVNLTLNNYINLFTGPALRWAFNSFFVSILTVFFVCFFSAMAGYAFAKKEFWGRNTLFWIMIATMALPRQVIVIPLYEIMIKLGLTNTYESLILPLIAWPFGVFLMKQYTQTLHSEILDAAGIDGSPGFKIFYFIVLPMVKPGIGALAIFTFMSSWNDYFWQLIMINQDLMKTLPLGVAGLQTQHTKDYGLIMAGSTIASLPMIVIFLSFQKYFQSGITMGAVKG
ncbi:carbohydrate ABC transporter permease [Candidatus Parcubacteria bacterium]|nr:MAG: carbohydrate ABC transporter permease [Candidatus Parcubacteria bacterium]